MLVGIHFYITPDWTVQLHDSSFACRVTFGVQLPYSYRGITVVK